MPVTYGTGANDKSMLDCGRPLPAHYSNFYGLPGHEPVVIGRAGVPMPTGQYSVQYVSR